MAVLLLFLTVAYTVAWRPAVASSVGGATNPVAMAYDSSNNYLYLLFGGNYSSTGTVEVTDGQSIIAAVSVGNDPRAILYDPANGYVYVTNNQMGGSQGTVSVISGAALVGTVQAGCGPTAMAYDQSDGYVYVSNTGYVSSSFCTSSDVVTVISGDSFLANVTLGSYPGELAYDNSTGSVYVATGTGTVSIISGTTVTATVGVAAGPSALLYDPLNGYVYVASSDQQSDRAGMVSVISGSDDIANASVGPGPQSLALDAANGDVYVGCTGDVMGGNSSITVIGGTKVVGSVPITRGEVATGPYALQYSPANGYVYVANGGNDGLEVISGTIDVGQVPLNAGPVALLYDPSNSYVYALATSFPSGEGTLAAVPPSTSPSTTVGLQTGGSTTSTTSTTSSGPCVSQQSSYPASSDKVRSTLDLENGTMLQGDVPDVPYLRHLTAMAVDAKSGEVFVAGATYPRGACPNSGWSYEEAIVGIMGTTLSPSSEVVLPSPASYIDYPCAMAYDPTNGYLYVGWDYGAMVTVVDPSSDSVVAAIQVGGPACSIVYDQANGYLYAASGPSGNVVDVIDGRTNTVVGSIQVTNMTDSLAFDPANGMVYGATGAPETYQLSPPSVTVSMIATGNDTVVGTFSIPGSEGEGGTLAYDPSAGVLLVAHNASVAVVDPTTDRINGVIDAGGYVDGLSVDPSAGGVYAAIQAVQAPGEGLATVPSGVALLDPRSDAVTRLVGIGPYAGMPTYDPSNQDLYVAGEASVSVLSASSEQVLKTVVLSFSADDSVYDPANQMIYALDLYSGMIVEVNGSTERVAGEMQLNVSSYVTGGRWYPYYGSPFLGTFSGMIGLDASGRTLYTLTTGEGAPDGFVVTAISLTNRSSRAFNPALLSPSYHAAIAFGKGWEYQTGTIDTKDNLIYISNVTKSVLQVSPSTGRIVGSVDVGRWFADDGVFYDPSNNLVYTSAGTFNGKNNNTIVAIDPEQSDSIVARTPTSTNIFGPIVYERAGDLLYYVGYIPSSEDAGPFVVQLTMVDAATNTIVRAFNLTGGGTLGGAYDSTDGFVYAWMGSRVAQINPSNGATAVITLNPSDFLDYSGPGLIFNPPENEILASGEFGTLSVIPTPAGGGAVSTTSGSSGGTTPPPGGSGFSWTTLVVVAAASLLIVGGLGWYFVLPARRRTRAYTGFVKVVGPGGAYSAEYGAALRVEAGAGRLLLTYAGGSGDVIGSKEFSVEGVRADRRSLSFVTGGAVTTLVRDVGRGSYFLGSTDGRPGSIRLRFIMAPGVTEPERTEMGLR